MSVPPKPDTPIKQPNLSAKENMKKYLASIGAKHVQKSGAILMCVSKEQREAMKK